MIFFVTSKGRGRIIYGINLIAFLLPIPLGYAFGSALGIHSLKFASSFWALLWALFAAGGTWWCALTICKTRERKLTDSATGQPVILKETHSLYGIPALGCAYIVTVVTGVVAIWVAYFVCSSSLWYAKSFYPKGGAIIALAENSFASVGGKRVDGNSPEAQNLAAQLDVLLKSKEKGQLSLNSPITPKIYCSLTSTNCTFIVDLPEPPYATDAELDNFMSKSWFSLVKYFKAAPQKSANLAVAIRANTYARVMAGKGSADASGVSYNIQTTDSSVYSARSLAAFIQKVAD